MSDPFAPIGGPFAPKGGWGSGGDGGEPRDFVPVTPIPDEAPPRPTSNPKVGAPSTTWCYRDAAGRPLGYVHRFDGSGGKQFRPQVLFRNVATGAMSWRWESWHAPRPLYGLDRLAARPDAPVILCEGEKAADAAGQLAPDHVAIASPNGSKSAGKADWTPLAGRRVTIWPDADEAGHDYAKAAVKLLRDAGVAGVLVLAAPEGSADGWDAADALAERWTVDRTAELLRSARAPLKAVFGGKGAGGGAGDPPDGEAPAPGGGRRKPQRDFVMAATDGCRFWVGTDGECYVTFPKNGHSESWPIRSPEFRHWVRSRVYRATGGVPGGQAIEDGLSLCEAIARESDVRRDAWRRVGRRDGKLYIDLCDTAWRSIVIDQKGWHIADNGEHPFIRHDAMQALPEPEAGSMIEVLRRFVNVSEEHDFVLTVTWLLAALRPEGPYPVMVINGEQGSGKSTFSKLLRSLIDPNVSPIRALPKDERDIFISADNSHCLVFDNISKIDSWLSDGLCRIATGGGYATRMLHSDRGEVVFNVVRPIILNGIPSLTDRPDLAERSVTINLSTIDETSRRPEREFWAEWEQVRPQVMGALYDAAARGLAEIDGVELATLPRMADFACWAVACEPGLGWERGTFMAAYADNRHEVQAASFEADPVAVAIHKLMCEPVHQQGWTGTASELLTVLAEHVSTAMQKSRSWPFNAKGMGNAVSRVLGLLRSKGLNVERKHSGNVRSMTITWRPL